MYNLGFDKKLIFGSAIIIFLTIIIIGCVNFYQSTNSFLSKGQTSIQNVSDVLLEIIELKYNLLKEKLDSELEMLISASLAEGAIMMVDVKPAQIEIFDFYSKNKSKADIPKMIVGLEFITDDYIFIDKVSKGSSSDIAIYQIFENKLVKVSTNIKNKNGTRPIGEYFSENTEAYKAILSDKQVSILTKNGGELAMQFLRPIKDTEEGTILGAYSVSSNILTKDLVSLIKKVTVGGNGYSFVSNLEGEILIHPDSNYRSLGMLDFNDGKNMLNKKSGQATYGHKEKTYYAYVNYFKPWQLYFTVAVSGDELMAGVDKQILTGSAVSGALALTIGLFIIWLMNKQLMKSMKGMARMAEEVAQGNFNYKFKYEAKDAIRDTVDSMNEMVEGLADMIKGVNGGVHTLSLASGELSKISDKMSDGAQNTVMKVNTVASAAEEMSVNMDSAAAAMEQASTNVEIVANGTNDMSSNIDKVSENSKHTMKISNKAVEQAQLASERVRKLGKAAEEINNVTDTINNISSQTNLLALNATIEAARAGDAGKGFAIVANEIKELAGQTAGATEDIAENIHAIQDQISGAVHEIQGISQIINQIDGFVNEASTAIELQSSTTNEIAENISQVSLGIKEVNVNVNQSSEVSGQVAKDISDVLEGSQEINDFSMTVKEKAELLENVSVQLNAMTDKFNL